MSKFDRTTAKCGAPNVLWLERDCLAIIMDDCPEGSELKYHHDDVVQALLAQNKVMRRALEYISKECEQVAEQELHAEVAIFGIYTSAQQALNKTNKWSEHE